MQAIILAAGMGKRLGDLTKENTKCMITVLDKTLIERSLDQLVSSGIKKIIIVIGFEGDKLKKLLGNFYKSATIKYINNPIYNKTNNIYSLYLAKDELSENDTILLESDLIFDDSILTSLINHSSKDVVVVAKYESWMDGTVVTIDENEQIIDFIPKKKFDHNKANTYYKTVNIYKFSKKFSQDHYIPFLQAYCKSIGHDEYYEDVLRVIAFVEKCQLKALPLNMSQKWYEIDDIHDLENAETIFAEDEIKLQKFQSRYGGYWRFPNLLDFCYLVNPYFPPKNLQREIISNFQSLLGNYPSGQSIMKLLAAKIFNLKSSQVLVGNGAVELINAYLSYSDKITGVILPTFEEYTARVKKTVLKKFTPGNDNFSYTAEDLIKFSEEIDQLILINPDNPSGNFISDTDVFTILKKLKEKNKILILDESFVDFADSEKRYSFLDSNILQAYPNLIVVKSLSKSYGIPGFRLGIMASSNVLLLNEIKSKISIWNINSFAEFFMQIFDKYSKEYILSCNKIVKARNILHEQLRTISYLRVIPSQANYFLCEVRLPFESTDLAKKLLCDYNILIKDCVNKDGLNTQNYIRIAVRDINDNIKIISALQSIQNELNT